MWETFHGIMGGVPGPTDRRFWTVSMGCSATLGQQTTGVFHLPNLGGEHTPPRAFNPLFWGSAPSQSCSAPRQHAESGLQPQISLRRPSASELRWCCGVKIKQTLHPKTQQVKLRVWFFLLLELFHIPVRSQLPHVARRFYFCSFTVSFLKKRNFSQEFETKIIHLMQTKIIWRSTFQCDKYDISDNILTLNTRFK